MNRQQLESKDQAAKFTGVYVEVYRGYKIRIARGREWGQLSVTIAGESFGSAYGHCNSDALSQANSARLYIDDSIQRPDAYTWSRAS